MISATVTPVGRRYPPLSCQISVAEAEQPSLRVERSLDLVPLLTGVVRSDEVLGAILRPLDRSSELVGEIGDEKVLGKKSPRTPKLPPESVGRYSIWLSERPRSRESTRRW